MAEMIPDRLPSRASAGELRVFKVLQKLPDDCIVYYEPVITERYPDFIVLMPSVGVLVIEAKGWYPTQIVSADNQSVGVQMGARTEQQKHPVRQARDYMYRLMDTARRDLGEGPASLTHADGERQGRFVFPFGHVALLNNCTRAQLNEKGLSAVFPEARVIARDEFDEWENLSEAELVNRLKATFEPWWSFPRLSAAQVNILRAIIHPEVRLLSSSEEGDLRVLDLRQERNARSVGEGHRVIYGVAGSGKTVILIARIKLLAEDLTKRMLLLCYNKALAQYFANVFDDYPNVDCHHFHGWAAEQGVHFDPDDEELGNELLERLENGYGDAHGYDAVCVDEAQDFACSWFRAAKQALRDPDDGDLIIVGDGNQTLYRRRRFTWAEAGVRAVGRTINTRFDLDRNYRNTRQIVGLAERFIQSPTTNEIADDPLPPMAPAASSSMRTGRVPQLVHTTDAANDLVSLLEGELENGLKPSQIAVLYRANTGWVRQIAERLAAVFPLNWTARESRWRDPNGVCLSTIHSAKGLQWKTVVILKPEQMPYVHRDEQGSDALEVEKRERGLGYVAITRAEDRLFLVYESSQGFVPEIASALSHIN